MTEHEPGPSRKRFLNAPVVAAMMLAVLLTPGLPSATAGSPGTCVNYEDDWGFGGSNVSCDLPCNKGAFLLVAGFAQDPDAGVSAMYGCGGQGAGCSVPAPACADASKYPTNFAEDATCWTDSDEFWSSTVYVACAQVGFLPGGPEGDPLDKICKIFDDFPACESSGGPSCDSQVLVQCRVPDSPDCDDLAGQMDCVSTIGHVAAICVGSVPALWTMSATDVLGLFPASFAGDIVGMRSLAYRPDHTVLSIRWDAFQGCSGSVTPLL